MSVLKAGYVCAGMMVVALAGCSGSSQPGGTSASSHDASRKATAVPSSVTSPTTSVASTASTAASHGDIAVMQSINTVLGDADAYRKVFSQLQQGVRMDDKQAVAKLVAYPLDVKIDGKPRTIRNAQEFIQSWDGIITPGIARVIKNQKFSNLFVNQKGVMFGDGQVWLSGICNDVACTSSHISIITIQK